MHELNIYIASNSFFFCNIFPTLRISHVFVVVKSIRGLFVAYSDILTGLLNTQSLSQ